MKKRDSRRARRKPPPENFTIEMKILLTLLAVSLLAGCARLPSRYEALDDHEIFGLNRILKLTEDKRVLFIGESHSDRDDHLFQLKVIQHLHAQGKRVAVAIEVFPRERQQILDGWSSGTLDEQVFERECDRIWYDLYSYYGDIFRFVRDVHIPLYGIGTVKGFINSVARQGTGIISLEQLQAIRFSGCDEDPVYAALMKSVEAMKVHEEQYPFFCEAQRLSDAIMAMNIVDLLQNEQFTIVTLAGAAHASKIAVPAMVARHRAVSYAVLLPASFRNMLQVDVNSHYADYIWY